MRLDPSPPVATLVESPQQEVAITLAHFLVLLVDSHVPGSVMRMTNMSPTNASTPRHRPDHQTLRLKISLNTLVDNDPILLQYVAHVNERTLGQAMNPRGKVCFR